MISSGKIILALFSSIHSSIISLCVWLPEHNLWVLYPYTGYQMCNFYF